MKGFYFLIGSFAAGEVIRLLWKRFREPFGGPKGMKGIDPMPNVDLGFWNFDFFEPVNYYYFVLARRRPLASGSCGASSARRSA